MLSGLQTLAIPRSVTWRYPSRSKTKFSGLMSRWITQLECRSWSPNNRQLIENSDLCWVYLWLFMTGFYEPVNGTSDRLLILSLKLGTNSKGLGKRSAHLRGNCDGNFSVSLTRCLLTRYFFSEEFFVKRILLCFWHLLQSVDFFTSEMRVTCFGLGIQMNLVDLLKGSFTFPKAPRPITYSFSKGGYLGLSVLTFEWLFFKGKEVSVSLWLWHEPIFQLLIIESFLYK